MRQYHLQSAFFHLRLFAADRQPVRRRLLAVRHQLAVVALALLLAACGGGGTTLTQQTQSYTIKLTLDTIAVGDRMVTVELADKAGRPIEAEQVMITPTMLSMGMASPEVTAQPAGGGRYQAEKVLVSMTGDWEMDVRVRANGADETARFTFNVPTQ